MVLRSRFRRWIAFRGCGILACRGLFLTRKGSFTTDVYRQEDKARKEDEHDGDEDLLGAFHLVDIRGHRWARTRDTAVCQS